MKLDPRLIVGIGVLFTSFSAILIRYSQAPALAIASWRMVFTTALVTPLFLLERGGRTGRHGRLGQEAPAGRPAAIRTAVLLSAASGAFLALHFALWISSLDYTSVASSTILVTSHPVIVALAGVVIIGERISLRAAVFMAGAFVGSIILVAGGLGAGESAALGNLLAWLGAVTVSGYMILGRIVRRTLGVHTYTLIAYSVSAILLTATASALGASLHPYPLREYAIFLALAIFCTLLGHSLYNWALRYLKTTVVSTSILGEPVIASVLAALLFDEIPTALTFVGGAIVLACIYGFVRNDG